MKIQKWPPFYTSPDLERDCDDFSVYSLECSLPVILMHQYFYFHLGLPWPKQILLMKLFCYLQHKSRKTHTDITVLLHQRRQSYFFLEKLPSKFSINHSTYLSAMDAFGGSMRDFTVAISAGVTGCVKRLSGFRCLEDALVTFLVTGDLGWWWASRVLLMGELTGCTGCVLYLEGRQEGRNWLGSNSYINSSDKPLTLSNGEKCLGVEPNLNVREDHSVLKMHL